MERRPRTLCPARVLPAGPVSGVERTTAAGGVSSFTLKCPLLSNVQDGCLVLYSSCTWRTRSQNEFDLTVVMRRPCLVESLIDVTLLHSFLRQQAILLSFTYLLLCSSWWINNWIIPVCSTAIAPSTSLTDTWTCLGFSRREIFMTINWMSSRCWLIWRMLISVRKYFFNEPGRSRMLFARFWIENSRYFVRVYGPGYAATLARAQDVSNRIFSNVLDKSNAPYCRNRTSIIKYSLF